MTGTETQERADAVQRFETAVAFLCPVCDQRVSAEVEVPEPDWGAEKTSDVRSEGETDVVCSNCETCFPAYVYHCAGSCDITLDDYPKTRVQADLAFYSPPPDDDWSSYPTPDNPRAIFLESYHESIFLLNEYGGEGSSLINRMIFAQQISALESYLGDTLINATLNDDKALAALLAKEQELSKAKYSLAQIAADPEFVKKNVRTYLKSLLYHNLPKVNALYQIVFDKSLFNILGEDRKTKLLKALQYRHDCVHRNGRDIEGNKHTAFTKEYVSEMANIMADLVDGIEDARNGPF